MKAQFYKIESKGIGQENIFQSFMLQVGLYKHDTVAMGAAS